MSGNNGTLSAAEKEDLKSRIKKSGELLVALGNETRLKMLCAMVDSSCEGIRAAHLAEKCALSRSTASIHLNILRKAGFIKVRREGTEIFYYIEPSEKKAGELKELFSLILEFTRRAPDREGDELDGYKVRL